MPKLTKGHNSRSIFSKFLEKLIRLSTHHYQSIHCFKALVPTVFEIFADKVKLSKITKGHNS